MELKYNENDGNESNVNKPSEVNPIETKNTKNQPLKVRQSDRIRKKSVKFGN